MLEVADDASGSSRKSLQLKKELSGLGVSLDRSTRCCSSAVRLVNALGRWDRASEVRRLV